MTELAIVIDEQGDLRHLNKDELNDMDLGEVVEIKRVSRVDVFDDLPCIAQELVARQYGSFAPYHLRKFPQHKFKWWIWIPTLNLVSGPYITRAQAIEHEITLLQDRGLPTW